MNAGVDMASVAALVGDPGRANMLAALMDGRAHTAGELANLAGVTAPTASGHLAKLERGRLVTVVPQGRHRYYRLASADIAHMLEGIMVVAAEPPAAPRRATPRIDPMLRHARTCYDHIAGQLGVTIADNLATLGAIDLTDGAKVTPFGRELFERRGLPTSAPPQGRRPLCRACLDWSERRPHLAGVLGAALLDQALALGAVSRRSGTRALDVNPAAAKRWLHGLASQGEAASRG